MSGKEFHHRDYIVHSPQQRGAFSDNTDDEREFVMQSKMSPHDEDIWGQDDEDTDDDKLDVDDYMRQRQKRSISTNVRFQPLVRIDPRYEEKFPEMSRTDKQIVTSLSEYWIQRGVIQRGADDDYGVRTDDDFIDMITSADQASQRDEDVNPDFATVDAEIIRHTQEHYSAEAGVNPFEDYDDEEDVALSEHKEKLRLAEESRKNTGRSLSTGRRSLSEGEYSETRNGLEESDERTDESEFLNSHVDFVNDGTDDDEEYSESIESLSVQSGQSYDRMNKLYSGDTRRLVTDLDRDLDSSEIRSEVDDIEGETIDGSTFGRDNEYEYDTVNEAESRDPEFKRLAEYAKKRIQQYDSDERRESEHEYEHDQSQGYRSSSKKPVISDRMPRKSRGQPTQDGRLRGNQDRDYKSSEDHHVHAVNRGSAPEEDNLNIADTVMVIKLIQKGLSDEDIVDVVDFVSVDIVKRLRQSLG